MLPPVITRRRSRHRPPLIVHSAKVRQPYSSSIQKSKINNHQPVRRSLREVGSSFHPSSLLPDHETLTLSGIVTLTNGKPSTVKLRLKELIEKGYLLPKGQGRGAHYVGISRM